MAPGIWQEALLQSYLPAVQLSKRQYGINVGTAVITVKEDSSIILNRCLTITGNGFKEPIRMLSM